MLLLKQSKPKVFCIGSGKTGTTSVEKALYDLGYNLGSQEQGELLIQDYVSRNFKKIVKFCKTAEAFQDAPFCFKFTYIALDIAFPDSKFILTIRDSADQWYDSLTSFHSKIHGVDNQIPSMEDLRQSDYRYRGYAWDVRTKVFGISEKGDPYDKKVLTDYYNSHNEEVRQYFRWKENLLEINVAEESAYKKMCNFLGQTPLYEKFPWENKTAEIK